MPKLIRVSFLTLIGLLLAMHPFAARAQSCNRYGTGSVYVAPPYQPYPGYAVPQSDYYGYNAYSAPGYAAYGYVSGGWRDRDWYGRRQWREHREHEHREHEWREHERREHAWRKHERGERGGW